MTGEPGRGWRELAERGDSPQRTPLQPGSGSRCRRLPEPAAGRVTKLGRPSCRTAVLGRLLRPRQTLTWCDRAAGMEVGGGE